MDILRSFPKLTAAGPSGLRIQHLIDAAEVPLQTPLLQTLRAVVNLLISGCAPMDAIFLAGGNLTALNKPTPGDIWPIAVGEVLRRLTGKCLCAVLRSKMTSFFEPYQFGVAVPCDAERIAHGLRICIDQHWMEHDFGVLKVDMTNAFNLVSRQAILSECAKHFLNFSLGSAGAMDSFPFFGTHYRLLVIRIRCPTRGSTWTHAIFTSLKHPSNENSKRQCML